MKFLRTNSRIPFLFKLHTKKLVMLDQRRRSKSRKLRAERILTTLWQKPSQAQIFPQKCWLPAEEEMSERMKDKQTSILANSCLHVHSVKTVNPKWCYLNILISKLKPTQTHYKLADAISKLIFQSIVCQKIYMLYLNKNAPFIHLDPRKVKVGETLWKLWRLFGKVSGWGERGDGTSYGKGGECGSGLGQLIIPMKFDPTSFFYNYPTKPLQCDIFPTERLC